MKIILLRHEKRGIDVGFFSELTDEGYIDSVNLADKLKKYPIDVIFSSPFTRTLQTVYFTSLTINKKVNVEYGLYEYLHNIYFQLTPWYYETKDLKHKNLKKIINKKYKSVVQKEDFQVLEFENNLEKRIIKFFNYLYNNYNDKTILIVTHKGVINKIKDLYVRKTPMNAEFDMGSFKIYDI